MNVVDKAWGLISDSCIWLKTVKSYQQLKVDLEMGWALILKLGFLMTVLSLERSDTHLPLLKFDPHYLERWNFVC